MTERCAKLEDLKFRARQLASDLDGKSEVRRIADRLARDPKDRAGAYAAAVYEVMVNGSFAPHLLSEALVLFHVALMETSCTLWERLCRNRGLGLEEENPEFESIWREEVRAMITECREEWLLDCDLEEYKICLLEYDADLDVAEELVEWISAIRS